MNRANKLEFSSSTTVSFLPRLNKTIKASLRHLSVIGILFGTAATVNAQRTEPLVWEFVNNYSDTWSDDQIWLMWAQSPSVQNTTNIFTATYGNGTQIDLTDFPTNNPAPDLNYFQQSTPVQLSSNSISTLGMNLTYVNSATLYIGFGDSNPFSSTSAPAFQTAQFPFMQVEITSTGAQADVADLTAINYFSFPLSLESYKAGGVSPENRLQYSGFGTNTQEQIMTQLKTTYTGTSPEVLDGNGDIVRILGPSSSYTVGAGGDAPYTTGGYATFQAYLGELYAQQTAPNAENPSSLKLSYTGNNGYTADATITMDGDENYGVTIENVFANTNDGPGDAVTGTIVINPDTDGNSPTSVTIYSGVLYGQAGTATGELASDGAYGYLTDTLLASLSASIVSGAAGSTVPFPGNAETPPNDEYRFQDSNIWFTQNAPNADVDPGLYFKDLQSEAYYDDYFRVISELSDYSLYGSPYADRFSNWSVAVNATLYGQPDQPISEWIPVDRMVITIGPVPEPTTAVLLIGAGTALMALRRRRGSASW